MRIGFAFAVALTALVAAPSSSAALAPSQDAATRASDPAGCAPPCFVYYYKKGSGTGIVSSTPAGMACTSDCRGQFGDGDVSLTALPTNNSVFRRWENCDIPQETTCFISPAPEVHICAVFDTPTSTTPLTPCPPYELGTPPPPAPPASPPPPPPSGPPALGSACTIPGNAGPNVINGTAGRDVICGRGGNDTINGRGGHDLILGGGGADRLTGGGGRDAIYGGSGTDTLFARDGVRDTVNGGLGRDRARWDAVDVRRSIERRF